jgi:hypothetical protein
MRFLRNKEMKGAKGRFFCKHKRKVSKRVLRVQDQEKHLREFIPLNNANT